MQPFWRQYHKVGTSMEITSSTLFIPIYASLNHPNATDTMKLVTITCWLWIGSFQGAIWQSRRNINENHTRYFIYILSHHLIHLRPFISWNSYLLAANATTSKRNATKSRHAFNVDLSSATDTLKLLPAHCGSCHLDMHCHIKLGYQFKIYSYTYWRPLIMPIQFITSKPYLLAM